MSLPGFARTMPRFLRLAAALVLLAVGTAGCGATGTDATSGGLLVPETTVGNAHDSASPTGETVVPSTVATTANLDDQLDEIDVLLEDLDKTLAEDEKPD